MPHSIAMPERRDPPDEMDTPGQNLEALRDPLTGYFRHRVPEQDEVPDLVQEVFLRLSTRGANERIANLRGYVFQVAASVLVDRTRRRAVRKDGSHVPLDPEVLDAADPGPDRIVAGRDALRRVMMVVDAMPERTRTVFVLRRLEGLAYRDIATRLGLSVSAVEKHMVRATERLARLGDVR